MVRCHLEDDTIESITERVRDVAKWEAGRRVTVEPTDTDTPYAGQELEGMPLLIDDVFWSGNDVNAVRADRHRRERDFDEPDDDPMLVRADEVSSGWVRINTIRYRFIEVAMPMSQRSLTTWEAYRATCDRVHLEPHDDTYRYVQPAEDDCSVCGCGMEEVSGSDSRFGHNHGRRACAACGYTIETWHP